MNSEKAANIDQYISDFPADVRERLELVRHTIHTTAPEAKEIISYAMPTFHLQGNLVHFAGYKNHIGFYPGAAVVDQFQVEISKFKTSKGTIQLPHDQELPLDLIRKIVLFRVKQNTEKALAKKTKTKVKK